LDRRNLVLELTDEGRQLIEVLVEHRRAAIATVLERVPASRRRSVARALGTFGQAAGEEPAGQAWKLGWHS
jgi:DNA-binding MarR family transcriptional regulator